MPMDRYTIFTDVAANSMALNTYLVTLDQLTPISSPAASCQSLYSYYRIAKAYLRMRPQINRFSASEPGGGGVGSITSELKPRLFTISCATSFDIPPSTSTYQQMISNAQVKEYSVTKPVLHRGGCTVEDYLVQAAGANQYSYKKSPWLTTSRPQCQHYMFTQAIVAPQRMPGDTLDGICQVWDREWVIYIDFKRMKY